MPVVALWRIADPRRPASASMNSAPAGVIFHLRWFRCRIDDHPAIPPDHGEPAARRAGHFVDSLAARGHRRCDELALFGESAGQVLNVARFHHARREVIHRGHGYRQQAQGDQQQLREDSGGQMGASNRYPNPRTVVKYCGSSGCSSILSRSLLTCTSTVRGLT